MLSQIGKYLVKQTALQLNNALSDRKPIYLANGLQTTEYQVWRIAFGNRPKNPRKRQRIASTEPIAFQELKEDRFGTILYQKICAVAPGRLFPPEYYVLEYQIPDAPFPIRVKINDPQQVLRAYIDLNKLSVRELEKLADLDRFKLVPAESNKPVFDHQPKDLVEGKLKTAAAITDWLVESYMQGRIPVEEFDRLMALGPAEQRSEVFCLIPKREQPRHEYLRKERKRREKTIEDQYRCAQITLREYEEAKFPELRAQREKERQVYPLPEPMHPCVVCGETKAQIRCMECTNRVCSGCIKSEFLGDRETDSYSYLLFHHIYCQKNGKPLLATAGH